METASPLDQAKIVRGVTERFPVGQFKSPSTRTQALRDELIEIARRLESGVVTSTSPRITSDVVQRAINDAETLIRTQGATSGVDRVHTAIHGYLIAVCEQSGIAYSANSTVTGLFNLIRAQHPKMRGSGPREQNVTQVLRALASILDAMNPVRNMASVAHPNAELLNEPEAMLVINACRTLMQYLDAKL